MPALADEIGNHRVLSRSAPTIHVRTVDILIGDSALVVKRRENEDDEGIEDWLAGGRCLHGGDALGTARDGAASRTSQCPGIRQSRPVGQTGTVVDGGGRP